MSLKRTDVRSVSELEGLLKSVTSGLVTFDGCDGAGKTYLARQIASAMGLTSIDLDCYLVKETGNFVSALRLDELTCAIGAALARSPVVLLSGVCMRQVLEAIDRSDSMYVYVQRNTSTGQVADSAFIDVESGVEVGLEYIKSCFSGLDSEVYTYHRKYRPWTNADIVFVRVAD